MDDRPDDATLLQTYAAGDRAPFEQLVRRHVDFVYATARRRVGDAHLADDVTQAVFLVLAAKAASLHGRVVLVGWLYQTTAYVASNALKKQRRRLHHERLAAAQRAEQVMTPEPVNADALGRLDTALSALPAKSRDALLLRFFPQRPLAEVGRALGISEEAAKKRVARAIDALRVHLAPQGAAPSAVATVALLDRVPTVSAPASVQTAIVHPAAATTAAQALAKGALILMTTKQIAAAAAVTLVVLLSGAGIVASLHAPARPKAAAVSPPPAGTLVNAPLVVTVPEGTFELLAVGDPEGTGEWWTPAGDAPAPRPYEKLNGAIHGGADHINVGVAYREQWSENANGPVSRSFHVLGAAALLTGTPDRTLPGDDTLGGLLAAVKPDRPITVRVHIASGPWANIASVKPAPTSQPAEDNPDVSLSPLTANGDGTSFDLQWSYSESPDDLRFVAIDRAGKRHDAYRRLSRSQSDGTETVTTWTLNVRQLRPEDVAEVRIEQRKYNRSILLRDLAIRSDQRTKPTVVIDPA